MCYVTQRVWGGCQLCRKKRYEVVRFNVKKNLLALPGGGGSNSREKSVT